MGVVIKGGTALARTLSLLGGDVSQAGRFALRRGAKEIAQRAADYAPLEYGPLESSIKVSEENPGVNQTIATVYVDEAVLAPQRVRKGRAVTVGDYASFAENNIPGNIGKGEESQAKAARLGVRVGPRFMARAYRDLKDKVQKDVEQAILDAIARRDAAAASKLVKAPKPARKSVSAPVRRKAKPKPPPVKVAKAKTTPRKPPKTKRAFKVRRGKVKRGRP